MAKSLEQTLLEHRPWYDSFDQNADSWGCLCDKRTGYRTPEEVVEKHIAPLIRKVLSLPESRLSEIQKRIDENGNLIRGQSNRQVWDDVNRLIEFCKVNKLANLAMAFADYEDERKRQDKAIHNLEDQITGLANRYREREARTAVLNHILAESGIDPDVLLMTHEVFAEKP